MCHSIARLDLPIYLDEFNAFKEYNKVAHNPIFFLPLDKSLLEILPNILQLVVLSLLVLWSVFLLLLLLLIYGLPKITRIFLGKRIILVWLLITSIPTRNYIIGSLGLGC